MTGRNRRFARSERDPHCQNDHDIPIVPARGGAEAPTELIEARWQISRAWRRRVCKLSLTGHQVKVAWYVDDICKAGGVFFAGRAKIGDEVGIDARDAGRALKALVDVGLLAQTRKDTLFAAQLASGHSADDRQIGYRRVLNIGQPITDEMAQFVAFGEPIADRKAPSKRKKRGDFTPRTRAAIVADEFNCVATSAETPPNSRGDAPPNARGDGTPLVELSGNEGAGKGLQAPYTAPSSEPVIIQYRARGRSGSALEVPTATDLVQLARSIFEEEPTEYQALQLHQLDSQFRQDLAIELRAHQLRVRSYKVDPMSLSDWLNSELRETA